MIKVVLIVIMGTPGNTPNLINRQEVPSIEECWKQAQEVMASVKDDWRQKGGAGIGIACEVHFNGEPS